MLARMLILLGAGVVAAAAFGAWRIWFKHHLQRLAATDLPGSLAHLLPEQSPVLLYFTTDNCAQCRYQQSPILEQFSRKTGVPVQKLDAVAQAELAEFYGVMTVPTTVLLSPERRPVAINYGLASLQKLEQQVVAVAR
jgi:thioredoxin 1